MEHKHEWGKRYRYWMTTVGMATQYTQQWIQGAEAVWLQECMVCHKVKHTRRNYTPKNERAGRTP